MSSTKLKGGAPFSDERDNNFNDGVQYVMSDPQEQARINELRAQLLSICTPLLEDQGDNSHLAAARVMAAASDVAMMALLMLGITPCGATQSLTLTITKNLQDAIDRTGYFKGSKGQQVQ